MEERYELREIELRGQLRHIELEKVPHKEKKIVVASFGPNLYSKNVGSMKNNSFRPATTSESISDIAYKFVERAGPKILNPRWFQAGRIIRSEDGVYINPLSAISSEGVNEGVLKSLRDNAKPFGKGQKIIRLGANDFAFVPYESFEEGVQSARAFAESGLARGLEYVEGDTAPNLNAIASTYPLGVDVFNFGASISPTEWIVELASGRFDTSGWFYVYSVDPICSKDSYASGVHNMSANGGSVSAI